MKPKGIRKRGAIRRSREGYTGIAVDLLSTLSVDINQISETVEVNNPLANPINAITESVGVVIT